MKTFLFAVLITLGGAYGALAADSVKVIEDWPLNANQDSSGWVTYNTDLFPSKVSCNELAGRAYRPLTWTGKVRLATAYFVNPELPANSEVLNAYPVNGFLDESKTDELWGFMQSGKAKFLVRSPEQEGAYLPVSMKAAKHLQITCTPSSTSEKTLQPYAAYLRGVSLESKDAFQKSLTRIPKSELNNMVIYVPTDVDVGIKSSGKFISWDAKERVSVTPKSGSSPNQ